MTYDETNIFAKILRGELPAKKLYEDDYALAFPDIHPQAPVHVLVIPKGKYISAADFNAKAPPEELTGFYRAVAHIARLMGVEESGYRLICNIGPDSQQMVPHFHVHILGGKKMGHLLAASA
ncbi:histidine triad nucleotide-binding protein [Acidocella sp.]|jgi:diadenosine tetraphosphate (Ap4A) HIT family hydrolase|uniref:histidine triad nucleotide-binding protein n=1 Tax=Acidocella sp. TaxID=50710 RepID=UPI002637B005|nr:histidine triad nucleotide-binding protein [Acidocella sp.]